MVNIYFDIYTVNCIKYKWREFISFAKNERCYFTDKKALKVGQKGVEPLTSTM